MARLLWWFIALLTGASVAAIAASGFLTFHTLGTAQQEAFDARFALVAQRTASTAARALALGLSLAEQASIKALLAREAAQEQAIVALKITSPKGELLLGTPAAEPFPRSTRRQVQAIGNDLGETVAQVQLLYDPVALVASRQALRQAVIAAAWPPVLALCAAMAALGWALTRHLQFRHAQARSRPMRLPGGLRAALTALAAVLLSLAMLWMGWAALNAGQALIQPDQLVKTRAIARSSASLIEHALAVGVPLDALQGLGAHTAALQRDNPEVASLALVTQGGRVLFSSLPSAHASASAHTRASVRHGDTPVAEVVVALDPGVLARRLRSTLMDMAFLSAVSLLVALELMALALGTRGARALAAMEARQQRVAHAAAGGSPWRSTSAAAVRPALFLFMLSEEFTRPFLPAWAHELAPADAALSPEMLAGLPLVLFLAVVALLQWPLSGWSERHSRRRGFVLGALLSAVGLALAASSTSYLPFLSARALSAVGFALVFVSAQGVVIDGSGNADRARSLAQFVRAILVAGLCGPPLGGLVADYGGVPVAFSVCAALALMAGAVAWWQLPADRPALRPSNGAPAAAGLWQGALRQPGLLALLLGCAMPAKLLLAGLCFYLLPVSLQDAGYGSAVIGRLQTIYPLTMVLLVPLAARLADHGGRRSDFVLAGGLLAGASALLAWPMGSSPAVLAWVLLGLGVGQALSIAAQSALVADFSRQAGPAQGAAILGMFRMIERGGSALGPACGALLLAAWGLGPALAAIGLVAVGGNLAYGWCLRRRASSATAL